MSTRQRKLRIERMEDRKMLAGTTFGALDPGIISGDIAPPGDTSSTMPTAYEFNLHSLPGAPATLFLDFNGHYQEEKLFDAAGVGGIGNILTPAFDRDGDPTTFNAAEQDEIKRIWAMVAEDFAPFNINVTTVDPDPGSLHPERPYLRAVISGGSDFTGGNNFGVSEKDWTGTFDAYADDGDPNVVYAFIKVSGSLVTTAQISTTVSHESGHAFGVGHYSSSTGNETRAPIMRESIDRSAPQPLRMVWWGSGTSGDMDTIASSDNGFGYRPDDHGGKLSVASSMAITNVGLYARGVIEKTTDVDMFRFETGGGLVTVQVDVEPEYVANLDAKLRLYNSSGKAIVTVDDPAQLKAHFTGALSAGTYYVSVGSHGSYGDVGQYSVLVKENSGPQIVSSQFQSLSSTQMGLLVTFSEPINGLTFTTADVRVNGSVAGDLVAEVQQIDSRQFFVIVNATPTSAFKVTVGPDILDQFGNRMDQNKNGINGEAADVYLASYVGSPTPSVTDPTISPSKPRKNSLTTDTIDTYFLTF